MNANEVIESYVAEVALQLPRKQRNDVAFELRALLHEELAAKAEAAGREADAAMATELVRGFGRPGDVAARYLPTLTVIDPADGPKFLRATVVGLVLIWCLGFWQQVLQPVAAGTELLSALGHWWGATVLVSPWWPGVLALGFGLSAWSRRRRQATADWKPKAADRIQGSRAGLGLAVVGILCGVYVLLDPRWVLDFFFAGRAAPAAYEALTYTATFRERLAPWMVLLLLLNVPIFLAVLVKGRWTAGLRHLQQGLSLITCAAMTWIVFDDPVFVAERSDRAFKGALVLLVVLTLGEIALRRLRSVRPTPNRQLEAE